MTQHHLICHCCGERMRVASAMNPNICVGCEQLLVDQSPADAAIELDQGAAETEAQAVNFAQEGLRKLSYNNL